MPLDWSKHVSQRVRELDKKIIKAEVRKNSYYWQVLKPQIEVLNNDKSRME